MQQYSNCIRHKCNQKMHLPAEWLALEDQIKIDVDRQVVFAGSRITMEKLVDYLLPLGWIPSVVPEFKGITVGGAISGAALESSSAIFGQFNDTCLSYLIWDGNDLLTLSPHENEDLFYGISGSYGSLGRILQAEIKIIPTLGFVKLSYQFHEKVSSSTDAIRDAEIPIEAIVYSPQRTITIEYTGIEAEEAKQLPCLFLNSPSSDWFYSHVDKVMKDRTSYFDAMPIKDYLFRHDRGAFWVAGYGTHISFLYRYAIHKLFGWDKGPLPSLNPSNPSPLFRFLFGRFADSQSLYRNLHHCSEEFFKDRMVIQDFYIPLKHAAHFAEHVIHLYGIKPLWLCPVRATTTPQLFSPHYRPQEELLINVGVYGIPHQSSAMNAIYDLEQLASAFGGRKMLYSYNFYDVNDFWQIYPKDLYDALRKKYRLNNVLDITKKVLSSKN